MFDLLKKKIAGFTEKILGGAKPESTHAPTPETQPSTETNVSPTETPFTPPETKQSPLPETTVEIKPIPQPKPVEKIQEKTTAPAQPTSKPVLPQIQQKEEREMKANVGLFQKIGGLFTGTLTLKEDTMNAFLEEFELSLLEADVELNTATALIEEMRKRLVNKTISSRENPNAIILGEIKAALHEILPPATIDFDAKINAQRPTVILILGPNGAGKTTTIAKLTHRLQKQGKKVIWGSADTFRAGSIEQLQVHADKLGVRLIKHQYGADPAAVAFDAVKAANAENADVVIIDTAGRQDTNKNLLEELKKIQRVIQPHLKLYVGESYTGQAILTQAKVFDDAIGIDGFILTKLDTDTKGGGVLSLLHNLHKPILFFGVGQGYEDLIPFSLDAFLERLIPGEA
jgi:fused signal recognition particle receptor